MNIFGFLKAKLTNAPATLTPGEINQVKTDKISLDLLKKFGIVQSELHKAISDTTLINWERQGVYQSVDRCLAHPLMCAAVGLYADYASTPSQLFNSTVWVTTENREYQYQIEKLFDVINLEEIVYDWLWTMACLRGDTRISLLDGTTPTIKEMSDNKDSYVGKYVWSINPETKRLEPDEIVNVFKTRSNADMIRIHLDNGEYIDCTPDHRFMLRDGSFKEAKDLVPQESLMPIYSKVHRGMNVSYNPQLGEWQTNAKLILTKEVLTDLYVNKLMSMSDIAGVTSCSGSMVYKYLNLHGIPIRHDNKKMRKKDVLTKAFFDTYRQCSISELKKLSGCSFGTIYTYAHKHNVKIIKAEHQYPLDEILTLEYLQKEYKENNLTTRQIASNTKVAISVIRKYLKRFDIPLRPRHTGEAQRNKDLNRRIYELLEFKMWKKKVFEHDDYTCKECGHRGGRLNAHHVKPYAILFAEFVRHYSQFSPIEDKETLLRLAMTWKPFWNIRNGKTLCVNCHKSEHKETYAKITQFKNSYQYLNHKVARVEKLAAKEDVYDLTTRKNHNFSTTAGVFVHNCFGDLFVQVHGQPGVGIVSISDDQHPINVSRVDYQGRLVGFYETPLGYASPDERKLLPPWEYVHGRLLGAKKRRSQHMDSSFTEFRTISIMTPDDRRLTSKYGTSILLDALPTWKRLRLAEDSVLMARINRGVLRYIYKIAVGENQNPEAVASLVDNYVEELKRARALDTTQGASNYQDRFNAMSNMEDIIIPVWGTTNNVTIEKIGGEVDIKWIVDIEELRNQLATALRVPLGLLSGYSKEGNSGGLGSDSVARMDIRFARQARRLQRSLINMLTRMVQIHLSYQGIDPDLNLFKIQMTETSTAEEMELSKALDTSVQTVDKVADLVMKCLGEVETDKKALLDYLNKKFLKLNDMDIEKLILKGNPNAFKENDRTLPVAGLEGSAGSEQDKAKADLNKPNPFREGRTISDLHSMRPLKESMDQWTTDWGNKTVKVTPIAQPT